jgi:hypothetical protein
MANEQNLRPFTSNQSREAAKKNGSKGGKASAARRQERKTLREGLLLLLQEPLKDKGGQVTDKTTQDAIIAGLVKRAINGDTRAFEMIRDTIGEKPVEVVSVNTPDPSIMDEIARRMADGAK